MAALAMSLTNACALHYRLGDIFTHPTEGFCPKTGLCPSRRNNGDRLANSTLRHHPDSIAGLYIRSARHHCDLAALQTAVANVCHATSYPSAALHLRLGDVVCGIKTYEKRKRPFSVADIAQSINCVHTSVKIVYGIAEHSNRTCRKASEDILKAVTTLPNVYAYQKNGQPPQQQSDEDFCTLVHSNVMIRGKGQFSHAAHMLRSRLNKTTVVPGKCSEQDGKLVDEPVHLCGISNR